uniref:Uncharacterized protein n=1 Tax=Anguilla anguilla TaxID=7936 RepID=A0A0E9WEI9_ANGAN
MWIFTLLQNANKSLAFLISVRALSVLHVSRCKIGNKYTPSAPNAAEMK